MTMYLDYKTKQFPSFLISKFRIFHTHNFEMLVEGKHINKIDLLFYVNNFDQWRKPNLLKCYFFLIYQCIIFAFGRF